MTREQMIDLLVPVLVGLGESPVASRRRLWRTKAAALQREMLLRGLVEYDEPALEEEAENDEPLPSWPALGWQSAPVYSD